MMALSIIILHILLTQKKKKKSYSTYGCIWYCSTHQIKKKRKKKTFFCFVDQTKGNTFSKDKDLSEATANDLW